MVEDKIVNLGDIPNFVKLIKPEGIHCYQSNFTLHCLCNGTQVPLEKTGENVVPYFDTGMYINLDTLNIITQGKKNAYNVVGFSLKLIMDELGVTINRDEILLALERFYFGFTMNEAFCFSVASGSMIANTVSSVIRGDNFLSEVLYSDIMTMLHKNKVTIWGKANSYSTENYYIDKSFALSKFKRLVLVLKALRTTGKDYMLRSCIEFPNYTERVLESLVGTNYSSRIVREVQDKLEMGVFDLESGNEEREFFEDFIDLDRLVCRIKKIKEGS